MRTSSISSILESLKDKDDSLDFPDFRDAEEFCKDNNIPDSYIKHDTGKDQDRIHIDNISKLIDQYNKPSNTNREGSTRSNSNTHRKKNNSYNYKGLEQYTDAQIRLFLTKGAIYKDSKGVYHVDWDKVNGK